MSQYLAFHRVVKITTSPPSTLTTDDASRIFTTTTLTIHSLDSFDQPMQTEIGLFADQPDTLRIEPA